MLVVAVEAQQCRVTDVGARGLATARTAGHHQLGRSAASSSRKDRQQWRCRDSAMQA